MSRLEEHTKGMLDTEELSDDDLGDVTGGRRDVAKTQSVTESMHRQEGDKYRVEADIEKLGKKDNSFLSINSSGGFKPR